MVLARKLLSRAALVLIGLALPPLLLLLGAPIFGVAPLTFGERNEIVNMSHFGVENMAELCRLGRHVPRAPQEIAVFGASSVEGAFATPGKDFPAVLQASLTKRAKGQWAVHNLGRSGRTSFWMKSCMKAAAQDKAAVWVAYEGHNDFADTIQAGAGKSLFFLRNPWAASGLDRFLSFGVAGWLRPFARQRGFGGDWETFVRDQEIVLAAAEANYRDMIETAQKAGARLVLATVISNLARAPSPEHLTGVPDGIGAAAAFRMAEDKFASGEIAKAQALYRLARDRDPKMWRAPSAFNELMRRLAAENPGHVTLLDLERDFEAEFGAHRKLGCEFFGSDSYCDEVHPNDFTHAWIARRLEAHLLPGGRK